MKHLEELNLLIDRAAAIAGSDYAVAKSIGVERQAISNWRHGHKPCPPEMQALMASVAGLDPLQTLARATVQKFEGEKKGDLLMRALGKASRLTGAAAGIAGAVALAIFGLISPKPAQATTQSHFDNVRSGKRRERNLGYVKP